jgi:histidyl-tRNA synthetase
VIRAYLEHNLARQARINKLLYLGPMFRYDKPGAGRYRQFHQLGIETIGTDAPGADAEAIQLLWDFLTALGLKDLEMRINTLGCEECRTKYSGVVKDALGKRLGELCEDCKERYERNPLRILDCKQEGCRKIAAGVPEIGTILCPDCVEHMDRLIGLIEATGVAYRVDPRLVRGLDYYTRTVFEAIHPSAGVDSSLGGGGRYDRLVEDVGGPPTPAVGFSAGLERVMLAAGEDLGGAAEGAGGMDVYLAPLAPETMEPAFSLATELRRTFSVWVEYEVRKPGGLLRSASRLGARYTLLLGPDELASGKVTLKHMESGEQHEVARDGAADWLAGRIKES